MKKRLGTPIKVKSSALSESGQLLNTSNMAAMDDADFIDPVLDNLNKEIAELRERRLTHNMYKNARMIDEDDFEGVNDLDDLFTETILGELGSSSSSHKQA